MLSLNIAAESDMEARELHPHGLTKRATLVFANEVGSLRLVVLHEIPDVSSEKCVTFYDPDVFGEGWLLRLSVNKRKKRIHICHQDFTYINTQTLPKRSWNNAIILGVCI